VDFIVFIELKHTINYCILKRFKAGKNKQKKLGVLFEWLLKPLSIPRRSKMQIIYNMKHTIQYCMLLFFAKFVNIITKNFEII